jgi:hypothetical protein
MARRSTSTPAIGRQVGLPWASSARTRALPSLLKTVPWTEGTWNQINPFPDSSR